MLRSKCHLYENIADPMAELRVKSSGTTSAEAIKTTLGRNQRLVLKILRQLSLGENISAMSYYGGSVGQTERCISIGRDCRLYYDVPWWIIDTRHAGAIFRQETETGSAITLITL